MVTAADSAAAAGRPWAAAGHPPSSAGLPGRPPSTEPSRDSPHVTPHRTPNPPCQLRHPGGLSLPLLLTDPPLTSMRSTVCPHEEEGPSRTEAAALGPEHQGLACALDARGATTPRGARRCLHGDAQQPHRHPAPLGLSRTPLASTAPARQRQAHVEVPPQLCGGPGATRARRSPPQGLPSRPHPAPAVCAAQEPLRAKPLRNRLSLDRSARPP